MTEVGARASRPARRWGFRLLAVLLPFLLLGLLEIGFRLTGVGSEDPWANHHVRFVSGERYFPWWSDTLTTPKPEGTTRIFVFGGSSVIARGMKPFPLCMSDDLAARFPDRRIEVVNGGVVAFGTMRVFEVMKEAASFEPDLFVVYTGHNEFLEKIFFDPDGFLAQQERVSEAVSRIRVIRWVRSLLGDRPLDVPRPEVQRHFVGGRNFPLIKDERQYGLALDFTESNVGQMCRLAADRDVPILVLPAVPNYLWSSGDPVHGPGYEAAPEEWDAEHDLGMKAWEAGKAEDAAAHFSRAAGIDDGHALLIHYFGLTDLELGRPAAGIEKLVRAVDLDRRGDRANSEVRGRIAAAVKVAQEAYPDRVIEILDLKPRLLTFIPRDFERYREGRIPALYADHCHLSAEGHRVVGSLVADAVAQILESRE